jgi:hypothetical protein
VGLSVGERKRKPFATEKTPKTPERGNCSGVFYGAKRTASERGAAKTNDFNVFAEANRGGERRKFFSRGVGAANFFVIMLFGI